MPRPPGSREGVAGADQREAGGRAQLADRKAVLRSEVWRKIQSCSSRRFAAEGTLMTSLGLSADRPAISIITVCMNREHHLLQSLPRVCAWPHHQEHIVVDWSSRSPIDRSALPGDSRIRLLRVEGESLWHPSQAYNFAASQARAEWLFRLDADCWVQNLDPLQWMHSNPADGWVARASQGGSLGAVLVRKDLFHAIGGFNELMRSYGFEDKDLIYRLEAQPDVRIGTLGPEQVVFIPHSAQVRANLPGSAAKARALKRATSMSNRFLAASCPWPGQYGAADYREQRPGFWILAAGTLPQPPRQIGEEAQRLRRTVFWGHFLLLPELYVIRAPQALLPSDRDGQFPIHWAHYLYWHTVRRLVALPLLILGILQRLSGWFRGRCIR